MEDRKEEDSKVAGKEAAEVAGRVVAGKEAAEVADGCRCHIGANNPWAVAVPLNREHEP